LPFRGDEEPADGLPAAAVLAKSVWQAQQHGTSSRPRTDRVPVPLGVIGGKQSSPYRRTASSVWTVYRWAHSARRRAGGAGASTAAAPVGRSLRAGPVGPAARRGNQGENPGVREAKGGNGARSSAATRGGRAAAPARWSPARAGPHGCECHGQHATRLVPRSAA